MEISLLPPPSLSCSVLFLICFFFIKRMLLICVNWILLEASVQWEPLINEFGGQYNPEEKVLKMEEEIRF